MLATDGAARAIFCPIATLRILYICSVQDELDHETALCALDLAHRWQVDVVIAILTDLLAGAQDVIFGIRSKDVQRADSRFYIA